MDQMKAPEIKQEVNREEERKAGGFFISLLSKLGGGLGSTGLEGLGAGAGQAGLAGGLLATKAGIIALALIGASVAGSLGVVGYKAFGPGSEQAGGYASLFEARPRAAGDASGAVDGDSQSLDLLVKANNSDQAGPQAGGAASSEAPAQAASAGSETAGSSSGQTPEAAAAAAGNNNNAPAQGAAAALKSDRKIGELSKISFGGPGSVSMGASAASAGPAPSALLASAKTGGLSAFPAGASSRAAARSARGIRRMGGPGSAFKQATQVRGDQKGAPSSASAGKTYDNSSFGNSIGSDGGFGAGLGQPGSGGGDAAPSQNPVFGQNERFPVPPPEKGADVTPWKAAIETAALLVAGAMALLFVAGRLAAMKTPQTLAVSRILAGVALLMGGVVVGFGAMIGGGAYGQSLQGGILAVSGGFIMTAAMMSLLGGDGTKDVMPGMPMNRLVLIMGAAGLAAAAAGYLTRPKSFPAATFKDGRPPDWDHKFEKAVQPNG